MTQPSVYQPTAPRFVAADPPTESVPQELLPSFAAFPFAPGASGFLDRQPNPLVKPFAGAVRFEYGGDLDSITRQGVSAQLDGAMGWAIDFHWESLHESLPNGGYDELHLGDANLMFRAVETDHTLLRFGLGVNWLGDSLQTDAGVNFTLKGDWAVSRPWLLSAEVDLGTVGDANVLHGAATLGYTSGRVELFGGYDYRRIGDATIQGPMLGLRAWF